MSLNLGSSYHNKRLFSADRAKYIEPEGVRTLTNTSIINAVAFSDDQTALMVPAPSAHSPDLEYTADTYGIQTSCQSVTMQCINPAILTPHYAMALTCSPEVNFNASRTSFGVLNSTGGVWQRPDLKNSDKYGLHVFLSKLSR